MNTETENILETGLPNLLKNNVSFSKSNPSRKLGIIGGSDATLGQYPHMAYLFVTISSTSTQRCQGALIAYNLVVTTGKFLNIKVNRYVSDQNSWGFKWLFGLF
jgi:hypothetical protein